MTTPASATGRDPLAIGLGALGCGLATGAASVSAALFVRDVAGFADTQGNGLIAGLAIGIAVATVTSWRLARPLDNLWQRGVVSVLAVFGALSLAFILTAVVHRMLGPAGLAVLGALLFIAGGFAGRWATRGRGANDEAA